ncbi:MAG: hypothetical protein CMF01_13000 [Hyphomonas sp.]|nr:ParB/RepB/Spo0J family partition protein [Hyphomonas sp.]MBB40994.1 hypothetical protein [Hyphomonas sp.]|tara:strand:+ start:3273 stop:5231 length:1959 start_codon:yes stop_codon:yes gene_type:complete
MATAAQKKPAAAKPAAKSAAPKKPATKRPAAKAKAQDNHKQGAGTAAPASAGNSREQNLITMLPLSDIAPSPLNPRKSFSEEGIAELAESIAAKGQLQNISVRKASEKAPRYHVIFGERRFRAMSKLAADGRWPKDAPVQVRVMEVDDAEHLELAIMENEKREEVHPLEQAEAYARLAALREAETGDAGSATLLISERTGETRRNVQLYLQVARSLTPEVKAAWSDGRIGTRKLAIAIARQPAKTQAAILSAMEYDPIRNPAELAEWLRDSSLSMEHALFDVEEYRAAGGEVSYDPETDAPLIDDEAAFLKLQGERLEDHARKLTETLGLKTPPQKAAGWYERIQRGPRLISDRPTAAQAQGVPDGSYIEYAIATYTGEVALALVAPEGAPADAVKKAKSAAKASDAPEVQPYARKNWIAGSVARTQTVRKLISASPEAAMALVIVNTLRDHGRNGDYSESLLNLHRQHLIADQKDVERGLPGLASDLFADVDGFEGNEIADREKAVSGLMELEPADLAARFATVIASQTMDLVNRHAAGPGSTAEARAIAYWAKSNRSEDDAFDTALQDMDAIADEDWFSRYTTAQLEAITGPCGANLRVSEDNKKPKNRADLAAWLAANRNTAWTPPEARFLKEEDMAALVDAQLKGDAA